MHHPQGPYCRAQGTRPNGMWVAWMAGEFGGEWIHVYVCLSFFAVHLNLPQQLVGYTPYKIKSFLKMVSTCTKIGPVYYKSKQAY